MLECPECKNKIEEKVFYCPICGKKIKDKPVAMDIWHITWLFFLSLLLPPLNLGLSIKYVKSSVPKAKKLGWISIAIMSLSMIIAIIWAVNWAQEINKQVNAEMDRYLRMY